MWGTLPNRAARIAAARSGKDKVPTSNRPGNEPAAKFATNASDRNRTRSDTLPDENTRRCRKDTHQILGIRKERIRFQNRVESAGLSQAVISARQ